MPNWTQSERKRPGPSQTSAAKPQATEPETTSSPESPELDSCYLPDFSATKAVVTLVLIAIFVAVVFSSLTSTGITEFLNQLANTSLLMMWMMITSAVWLSAARRVLGKRGAVVVTAFSIGMVLANIALLSVVIYWLGQYMPGNPEDTPLRFPTELWEFLWRNLAIGGLIACAVLRYFYVMHQWRTNVEKESRSRIKALQARIRPHFLFNSMNTIAALTRTDPEAAERAVEDLAELFRASLSNPGEPISLEQELDVARVYQRMEEQRLGKRLEIDWQVDDVPMQTRVPGLTIQPLLENAIYHGIEPLADGGTITIVGEEQDDMVRITVSNPVSAEAQSRNQGNRIALDNIRQRLELAYGDRALLEVEQLTDRFRVLVGFPVVANNV